MSAVAILRLARVSNLPTVWSNVLAASVLAGGMGVRDLAMVMLAMSALYTGGMVLNDAFDREIDTKERPERPLPAGEVSATTAWTVGGALLAMGFALLASFGLRSALAGLALAIAILVYNAWHKGNPVSPVIMGLCRALVYVGTVLAAGSALVFSVLCAAGALLIYIVGLTQLAKQGVAYVGTMIAGISLFDAGIAALGGNSAVAFVCVGLFFLTLALQRIVRGT